MAVYRQRVLTAFGDVENTLSAIQQLGGQGEAQQRAVTSARRAAELAGERYRSGIVGYLDVVEANRAALGAERVRAQITGQRFVATVQLIRALGGGWESGVGAEKLDGLSAAR